MTSSSGHVAYADRQESERQVGDLNDPVKLTG